MSDAIEMQAELKILSDAYAAQLPEKLKQIEQAWCNFPSGEWHEEDFHDLYRMVHRLSGAGKMFGFPVLSDTARNLEAYLLQLSLTKAAPSEEQCNHIQILINDLHRALNSS
jgi:HPt (histidine-containing phosphotransfer) domain-containing protein